jgi:hypothetical protein
VIGSAFAGLGIKLGDDPSVNAGSPFEFFSDAPI